MHGTANLMFMTKRYIPVVLGQPDNAEGAGTSSAAFSSGPCLFAAAPAPAGTSTATRFSPVMLAAAPSSIHSGRLPERSINRSFARSGYIRARTEDCERRDESTRRSGSSPLLIRKPISSCHMERRMGAGRVSRSVRCGDALYNGEMSLSRN